MGLISNSIAHIGIDIGADTLRAVALQSHGSEFRVLAAAETMRTPNHPLPTETDVIRLVRALERQGITRSHVVISAPPDRLASAILELPPRASGAPIEALADAEMGKNVDGQFESQIWDLSEGPRSKAAEYLVVALPYEVSEDLLRPFENAGLSVDAIEPEAAAIGRVTGQNNRLVLDVGRRGVRVYAYEGQRIMFMREFVGAQGRSFIEQQFQNIASTIDYLAERFKAMQEASVVLVGDPVVGIRLKQLMMQEFDTAVSISLHIELHRTPWLEDADLGVQWTTALGLAARAESKEVAA